MKLEIRKTRLYRASEQARTVGFWFFWGTFLGLAILFFSYHTVYAKKVLPGVSTAEIPLGGLDPRTVRNRLTEALEKAQAQPLIFELVNNYTVPPTRIRQEVLPAELGLFYQPTESAIKAFQTGRSRDFFEDIQAEWQAWFHGLEVDPAYELDFEKFERKLLGMTEELGEPARDAEFVLRSGELVVVPDHTGLALDSDLLRQQLLESFFDLTRGVRVVTLEIAEPEITTDGLTRLRPHLETLLSHPPTLTYQARVWTLSDEQILDFLRVEQFATPTFRSNQDLLDQYVVTLAKEINVGPKGQILRAEGLKVLEFQPASLGLTLNQEETAALLSVRLLNPTEESLPIVLPVEVATPPESENAFGIQELLGEGITNFSGSSQGRVNNIIRASGILNGLLIPPGEEFSFNQSIGEISARTGYDQAWVISRGRTVLGTGGGVCQVSTTTFRAILDAGLPVLQRTAHAYRVHYYEPPTGMDATVYSPSPDLVFENDTPAYLLLTAEIDVPTSTATFRFYGTSDGREVEISAPIIHSQTPPPEAKYEETDALPEGVTEQVDWSAWGANVTVTRLVTRDGEILQDDSFFSSYRPWQAVYLVGKKRED